MINRFQIQLEKIRSELYSQRTINENSKRAISILAHIETTFFKNIHDYKAKNFSGEINAEDPEMLQNEIRTLQMENQNLNMMVTKVNEEIIEEEKEIHDIISEIQKNIDA